MAPERIYFFVTTLLFLLHLLLKLSCCACAFLQSLSINGHFFVQKVILIVNISFFE